MPTVTIDFRQYQLAENDVSMMLPVKAYNPTAWKPRDLVSRTVSCDRLAKRLMAYTLMQHPCADICRVAFCADLKRPERGWDRIKILSSVKVNVIIAEDVSLT